MSLPFTPQEMLAIVVGASFAAGLNVYATVAVLGLLVRAHLFTLPPSLHLVEAWPTIAAAIVLFVLEFIADKIPGFDLIWNALQTFVRVPVAGGLGVGAGGGGVRGGGGGAGGAARVGGAGGGDCAGGAGREDGSAGNGDPVAGAGIEHRPEPRGGRGGD